MFHRERAEYKLRWTDELHTVSPHSDADELHRFFDDALSVGAISTTLGEGEPLLAVSLSSGPTFLGSAVSLRQRKAEDPIAYTLRILAEGVEDANRLIAERHADSIHLDNIAAYMNGHRPWNGGDVCDFVATELIASGRTLSEEDED